ncbi:glycosyltransferase family 32 protein [Polychaeton citri CBS 116435]|uniref:Glycosyltransferase family 32 protein n=1 Tax=Polychaeton citri CBS 116435 TaxID=1314669 RepID=A0A9P4QF49_9PEZI|nr:glycosyltransferase family 32 protein [Polychaeton citri CBS 116435]
MLFRRRRSLPALCFCLLVFCSLFFWQPVRTLLAPSHKATGRKFPLTDRYVNGQKGRGGRWYIPPSWQQHDESLPLVQHLQSGNASILNAAEYVLDLALHRESFLNNSHIPLVVHQTWYTLESERWPSLVQDRVERWIESATGGGEGRRHGPEMAWFLWDDEGLDALIEEYEPHLHEAFGSLPYPVEKADVFRVAVLKWFGGVYADIDTDPLRHPYSWVYDTDLLPWTESGSDMVHTLHKPANLTQAVSTRISDHHRSKLSPEALELALNPKIASVGAIFGIEADNPPAPDSTYWRMGYFFPVQITNWAMALSPLHPAADAYLQALESAIARNRDVLPTIDPLELTGPPALTSAVSTFAKQSRTELSWDALSSRLDDHAGGRGKIVAGDILILPITGFSPGRGRFHNMGSMGFTHQNARLSHAANGSWRKKDLKVEIGKFCRVTLGLCRDWKKIPS